MIALLPDSIQQTFRTEHFWYNRGPNYTHKAGISREVERMIRWELHGLLAGLLEVEEEA